MVLLFYRELLVERRRGNHRGTVSNAKFVSIVNIIEAMSNILFRNEEIIERKSFDNKIY